MGIESEWIARIAGVAAVVGLVLLTAAAVNSRVHRHDSRLIGTDDSSLSLSPEIMSSNHEATQEALPAVDDESIRVLFSDRVNEDGFAYDLHIETWDLGSFTSSEEVQALVKLADWNQCHASRGTELWLITYEDGWRLDRRITESDLVYYRVVDICQDGTPEVWFEQYWGNHGYDHLHGEVISLDQSNPELLYTYEGHDFRGAGAVDSDGYAAIHHAIDFRDVDGDNTLELIDVEYTLIYGPTESADYDFVMCSETESIFHLVDGRFVH